MIEVSSCVICEGPIHRIKRALVAPFMAERIWNRKPFHVDLVECQQCSFLFYNPRLEDEELAREYAGWRSPDYQAARNSFEPWFTPKMNAEIGSPESYRDRRQVIHQILFPYIKGRSISRVLEFGGDRGDLAAGLIDGAEAFVYDISGAHPIAGVTAVTSPESCKADLIVNSNVLEHVGFPREFTAAVFKASPQGGWMFFEAPCEKPLGAYRITRRIVQAALTLLLRPQKAAPLFRPSALYLMHEHINYFTERSLTTLITKSGGNVIASGVYPFIGAGGNADMAWCLTSK